jgi:hypothetical protein
MKKMVRKKILGLKSKLSPVIYLKNFRCSRFDSLLILF